MLETQVKKGRNFNEEFEKFKRKYDENPVDYLERALEKQIKLEVELKEAITNRYIDKETREALEDYLSATTSVKKFYMKKLGEEMVNLRRN